MLKRAVRLTEPSGLILLRWRSIPRDATKRIGENTVIVNDGGQPEALSRSPDIGRCAYVLQSENGNPSNQRQAGGVGISLRASLASRCDASAAASADALRSAAFAAFINFRSRFFCSRSRFWTEGRFVAIETPLTLLSLPEVNRAVPIRTRSSVSCPTRLARFRAAISGSQTSCPMHH